MDDAAFNVSTQGVMQPHLILRLEEGNAVVNPQNFQPREAPQQLREQTLAFRDTDESSLDSIMALPDDLKTFQEFEGYRYRIECDSESDVPQDYPSDDEASMEEISVIEAADQPICRSVQ